MFWTRSCFPLGWWVTFAFYEFPALWRGTSIIIKMKVIYLKFLRWSFFSPNSVNRCLFKIVLHRSVKSKYCIPLVFRSCKFVMLESKQSLKWLLHSSVQHEHYSMWELLKIPWLVNCISITEALTRANKEQGVHSLKLLELHS